MKTSDQIGLFLCFFALTLAIIVGAFFMRSNKERIDKLEQEIKTLIQKER